MALLTHSITSALQSAYDDSSAALIQFENSARYNQELRYTFERTVSEVSRLGSELRILEIGAFTGVVSVALKRLGHLVTASDMPFVIKDPALESLFAKDDILTLAADLSHMPFPVADASFDLIVFNEVLEHLNFNSIPLLREFHRILTPGGRVYCATPNLLSAKNRWLLLSGHSYINPVKDLLWNLEPGTGMSVGLHWREWSHAELVELFQVAGFDTETHHFGLSTPNCSGPVRKTLVSLMYHLAPSLMPNQVGVFRKI